MEKTLGLMDEVAKNVDGNNNNQDHDALVEKMTDEKTDAKLWDLNKRLVAVECKLQEFIDLLKQFIKNGDMLK